MRILAGAVLVATCTCTFAACAADREVHPSQSAFDHWPQDLTINGTIIAGDPPAEPGALGDLLEESLSERARQGRVSLLVDEDIDRQELIGYASLFSDASDYRVVRSDRENRLGRLPELLEESQTFLWRSTRPLDDDELASLPTFRGPLSAWLQRGGTLIFLGPAANAVGSIAGDQPGEDGSSTEGLGLFPDSQIQFVASDDSDSDDGDSDSDDGDSAFHDLRSQLRRRLERNPRSVGFLLDRGSLIRLAGRIVSVHGSGSASVVIASRRGDESEDQDVAPSQTIKRRQSRRQSGNDYLIDLTQWRRRAIDSTLPPFPPKHPDPPVVPNGTLVIVGGGGMPKGLMERFVELAGGREQARLVYVPCSEADRIEGIPSTVRSWKAMGVEQATFIHTKDRDRAHRDEEFLQPLKGATGIWFGGGRQWNFADSYYGTRAQALMQEVLERGGVVGGSSAGASIQARFLARATPIENTRILAPGYERGGLGFISGVAIDQHFSQRNRQPDLRRLVKRYPQMLGIGIDESTALVVAGSMAEVVGRGDVYFYDRPQTGATAEGDYTKVTAGQSYDLVEREIVMPAPTHSPAEDSSEPVSP